MKENIKRLSQRERERESVNPKVCVETEWGI